jgi:predicted transcriptional regulator
VPNPNFVDVVKIGSNETFVLNAAGLALLESMSKVGCSRAEIAKQFGVSPAWVDKRLTDEESTEHAVAARGDSGGALELRTSLHEAAVSGDMKAATFLAERRLGMRKEVEHNHKHGGKIKLISAEPDYKAPTESWIEKYRPKDYDVEDATLVPTESSAVKQIEGTPADDDGKE